MPEYKDCEALSKYFQEKFEQYKAESEKQVCGGYVFDEKMQFAAIVAKHFLDKVKATPAADVVEVRHGKWIEGETITQNCSCCGFEIDDDATYELYFEWSRKPKFCPECGAKMDGTIGGDDAQ